MAPRPAKRKKSTPTKRKNPDAKVHNMYLCDNCRRDHKPCDYSDPSSPCQRCVTKGWSSGCGNKSRTKKELKPDTAPIVTQKLTLTPTSAAEVPQNSTDENNAKPSAMNRVRSSFGSEYSQTDIITCFIDFQILLVSEKSFLQLLKSVPLLDERRTGAEAHIDAIVSWLEITCQTLMNDLSAHEHRLLEPLRKIQTVLNHDFEPTTTPATQRRTRTTSTVMLDLWKVFSNTYPGARDILTCVGSVLSELYSGAFDLGLSTREWDDPKREQLYGRVSGALNSIYNVYLSDCPRSPTDILEEPVSIFPYWQIAYRNKDKEWALQVWKRLDEERPLVDFDCLGLCLAHWAIWTGDHDTLKEMTACNMFVGHRMKSGRLELSPCEFAIVMNSLASYCALTNWILYRLREFEREFEKGKECLSFAARIRSWDMVRSLASPTFTNPPYSEVIGMAFDAGRQDIASELLQQMGPTWIPAEYQALADHVAKNGPSEFAQEARNMLRHEVTAGHALAAVGNQEPSSQHYANAGVFQGYGINHA